MSFSFELIKKDEKSAARRGQITTPHGKIQTPVFMPVGTRATVKGLTPRQLEETGAQIMLSNTYHLFLRPGDEIVRLAGGLHKFMNWPHPILTDSGGFQVYSLSDINKITDDGVEFRSHIDGSKKYLNPEIAMKVQENLGADIIMAFDQCSPYPCDYDAAKAAMERTHAWARRCLDAKSREDQALFGIVQGAFYSDLRIESAKRIASMPFAGCAIGGLSVGEPKEIMYDMLETLEPHMPVERPRYLMGVGSPDCLMEGVKRGIDMFDCVLATRVGRNGTCFTSHGRLVVRNAAYAKDFTPIEDGCGCYACQNFSRAYIRHLLKADEMLGLTLCSVHNIHFLIDLMAKIRQSIEQDSFDELYNDFFAKYNLEGRNF